MSVVNPPPPPPAAQGPRLPAPRRRDATSLDETDLRARVNEIAHRWPTIGLAVGIVHHGRLDGFAGHGLASIATGTPVTDDTVFRIGSVTKLFTAIAVMQLWEEGRIDLDAPANDYLRAYRLVQAKTGSRPATIRHLLTHTAGIPEIVHLADLLHPGWGNFMARPAIPSVAVGEPLPSLAEYYRRGLRIVVEPGTTFAYSNHGFATLGQIVEDVTGQPLDRVFRERIFEPLGMASTDLLRSERVRSRLATGSELGSGGPEAVTDREWLGRAGGGVYSTTRDMARFVAAVLAGGAGEHGRVLRSDTLETMFTPQFQPDPRLTGMGLGFLRADLGGHRLVEHDGILPGFTSLLIVAPDDDIGIVGFTNGSSGARVWLANELGWLLRRMLGVPEDRQREDLPHHPARWPDLCGEYRLPPRVSDLRGRLAVRGVEVSVRGGRLIARLRTPVPGLSKAFRLQPDAEDDPDVFRVDLISIGLPVVRVAFAREPRGSVIAAHTDLSMLSFQRRPARSGPSPWLTGAVGALTVAGAVHVMRRRARSQRGTSP
ncbi:MAG TPA: serine hydrolase domain-containing protein [Candidatus Limnocylindrales bacterium]|nr:serine hydrolase domain-containing protein [Candidatus Limnocylindrales bacterium]